MAIPIEAGMAIVLWIGMMIVAQAFQATPRDHAAAVVVGLLPGIGAWGVLMAKNGLRAAGLGGPAGSFSESLIGEFQKIDTWIAGAFAVEGAARKVDQYAARKVIQSEGGSFYVLLALKNGIGLWECGNLAFSSEIPKLLVKAFCDFRRSVISTAARFRG